MDDTQKPYRDTGPIRVYPTDVITLRAFNNVGSITLTLTALVRLVTGERFPYKIQFNPTQSVFPHERSFNLHNGWIESATLEVTGAANRRGQVYARADIRSWGQDSSDTRYILFADYVNFYYALSWPPGQFRNFLDGPGAQRNFAIAAPAAGAQIGFTQATGTIARLNGFRVTLTTAVAAANRRVRVTWLDSASAEYAGVLSPVAQVASLTYTYRMARSGYSVDASAQNEVHIGLPDIMVYNGGFLVVTATNLQAADQFSAADAQIEEWIQGLT